MRISAFYEIAKYYFRSHMPHADAIFQNLYNNLYIYIVFLGGFGYAFASKRIRLRGLPIGSEADTAGGCAIARAGNTRNKSPFGACRRRSGGFSDHTTPQSAAAHPQIGKNKKSDPPRTDYIHYPSNRIAIAAYIHYPSSRQQTQTPQPMPSEGK